ncbi:hypothetical protein GCM10027294_54110 [Marinactinospora endophytica]
MSGPIAEGFGELLGFKKVASTGYSTHKRRSTRAPNLARIFPQGHGGKHRMHNYSPLNAMKSCINVAALVAAL